jgi:putative flippase GtrA
MRLFHGRFRRFVYTGLFNTANGYAWILGLQVITDQPLLANMLGYGIAAVFGYIAHSRYTFRQKPSRRSAACYSVVIGGSYLINLAMLKWSLTFLPGMLSQTLAISIFVVINYLGQSRFAFLTKRDSILSQAEPTQSNDYKY